MLSLLAKLKLLIPFLGRLRGVDWAGIWAALSRGSWRTRLAAVCAVVLFVVCVGLSLLGINVPEAVWAMVPTVAVAVVGWMAQEDAVARREAAGATPVTVDADQAAMLGPPVVREPPPRTDKVEWPPKRI